MAIASAAGPAERLRTYAAFVRFEHTLFSLPLLLAGIFSVAGDAMSAARWLVTAIAAVTARSAALAMNRLIDWRLDALNPRTRGRELPAGRMRFTEAWALLLASMVAYLAACAWLGPWYLRVSAVPLAAFAAYPYLKRFTPLCHFGVGVALALAPLAGYAAAHPDLAEPGPALWLAAFAFFWVSGFDVIYATLDEDFDRGHGVRSMVAWLGRPRALNVSAGLHALAFACLVGGTAAVLGGGSEAATGAATGMVSEAATGAPGGAAAASGAGSLAPWALAGTAAALVAAGILLYLEQRWAEDVDLAFFKVNVWVGFAVLATVLLGRAVRGFGA